MLQLEFNKFSTSVVEIKMFTEALCKNTCRGVIDSFNEARPTIIMYSLKFNLTFPIRTCWRDIPLDLVLLLKMELKIMLDLNSRYICGEGGSIEIKNNFRYEQTNP